MQYSREGPEAERGEIDLDLVTVSLNLAVAAAAQFLKHMPRRLVVRQVPADRSRPLSIVMVVDELVYQRDGVGTELSRRCLLIPPSKEPLHRGSVRGGAVAIHCCNGAGRVPTCPPTCLELLRPNDIMRVCLHVPGSHCGRRCRRHRGTSFWTSAEITRGCTHWICPLVVLDGIHRLPCQFDTIAAPGPHRVTQLSALDLACLLA